MSTIISHKMEYRVQFFMDDVWRYFTDEDDVFLSFSSYYQAFRFTEDLLDNNEESNPTRIIQVVEMEQVVTNGHT